MLYREIIPDASYVAVECLQSLIALRPLQVVYASSSKRIAISIHEPLHRQKQHFPSTLLNDSFSTCLHFATHPAALHKFVTVMAHLYFFFQE